MFERYLAYEYHVAAAQLMFAMLGMGATLTLRDFLDVFREPRAFAAGMAAQLVAPPLIALLLAAVFQPPTGLALGFILMAAVPGGTMSNIVTWLARGNVPLSISLTAVTTLGCLAMTPVLLRRLLASRLPPDFAMPAGQVAFEIGVCLLLPLAAGMLLGGALPHRREAISTWSVGASFAAIGVIIVGSAGAGRIDAMSFGWQGPAMIALFAVALQQAAMLAGLLVGLSRRDLVAIGLELTIRNSNLALLIKASLFPVVAGVSDPVADGVLFTILLYGGIALPAALPLVWLGRRGEVAARASATVVRASF
jgi:BASS family bile acid:Na+ symporter